VNGRIVNDIFYAEDTVFIAGNSHDLQLGVEIGNLVKKCLVRKWLAIDTVGTNERER